MAIRLLIHQPSGPAFSFYEWTGSWMSAQSGGFSLIAGGRGQATIKLYLPPTTVYLPKMGAMMAIFHTYQAAETCVFAGVVGKSQVAWIGNAKHRILTISCYSLEQYLDTITIPPQAFFNQTTESIITSLMNALIIPYTPIYLGTIDPGIVHPVKIFRREFLGSVLTQLANEAGCTWGIDPSPLTSNFSSIDPSLWPTFYCRDLAETEDAPWTLTDSDLVWDDDGSSSLMWSRSPADYRNRQFLRISKDSVAPRSHVVVGNGSQTNFDLPGACDKVTQAFNQGSVGQRASATGTFSGVGVSGDLIIAGGVTYQLVSSLAQVGRQSNNLVLMGMTAAETASHLTDALNANSSTRNVVYANVAGANPTVLAEYASGATLTVKAIVSGTVGNDIALGAYSSSFAWSAGVLSGGIDPSSETELKVGTNTEGSLQDLYYTEGSNSVRFAVAPVSGDEILIYYFGLGDEIIEAQDTGEIRVQAAIENSHGYHDAIEEATSEFPLDAQDEAAQKLEANNDLSDEVVFRTRRPGLRPGQILSIDLDLVSRTLGVSNLEIQNVSLGKTATLSSTLSSFDDYPHGAAQAIDGDTNGNFYNGSVAHSAQESRPWLEVDLGQNYPLHSIRIWNRTDGTSGEPNWLNDYYIFYSPNPYNPSDLPADLVVRPNTQFLQGVTPPNPSAWGYCNSFQARYIRVQLNGATPSWLAVAELEVFAYIDVATATEQINTPGTGFETETVNLALNKPVTGGVAVDAPENSAYIEFPFIPELSKLTDGARSGRLEEHAVAGLPNPVPMNYAPAIGMASSSGIFGPGYEAINARDDNTDGDANHGSVFISTLIAQPWWEYQGPGMVVTSIEIWNRTDSSPERLSDFWVFASMTPFQPSDTPTTLQNRAETWSHHQTTMPDPNVTITLDAPFTAQYVRVQLSGTNYLQLAEVKIFGDWVPAPDYSIQASKGAYMDIDLDASKSVTEVRVWGNLGPVGSDPDDWAPSDFYVFVSNTPFGTTDTAEDLVIRPNTWSFHQAGSAASYKTVITTGLPYTGRYVRYQKDGTMLGFCFLDELEVMGPEQISTENRWLIQEVNATLIAAKDLPDDREFEYEIRIINAPRPHFLELWSRLLG